MLTVATTAPDLLHTQEVGKRLWTVLAVAALTATRPLCLIVKADCSDT
jgi:hypothetical protein